MEVIYNKEHHGVTIYIKHTEEHHPTHHYLVGAYDENDKEIIFAVFDGHYIAKKVCQWLMGGYMVTGKLPTKEDLRNAKTNLGFH